MPFASSSEDVNVGGVGSETTVLSLIAKGAKAGQKVLILARVLCENAAASTDPVIRVRRGTTAAGALVGEADTHTLAALQLAEMVVMREDNAANDDPAYNITLQTNTGTTTARNMQMVIFW